MRTWNTLPTPPPQWGKITGIPSDLADGQIDWSEVGNKPLSFPASTHNHDANYLGVSANAISASKLATSRTISLSGDATGSVSFDGSANVSITVVVVDDSHNHIIANVDGLQASLDSKSATTHNHTLDGLSNTTITSILSGEILRWNGTAWINNTLAEAGIATSTHNHNAAYLGISANAVSASKLATARTISLSGDATGSASFDGSANAAITVTIADDSHNHTIANVDGLQTSLDGKSASTHNHTISSLSDTTITSILSGEILRWNGTAWVNATLSEAGIAVSTHNHDADYAGLTGTNVFNGEQKIDREVESGINSVLRLLSGNTLNNRAYNLASLANGNFVFSQTNDANNVAKPVLAYIRDGGVQICCNGIPQIESTIRGMRLYNVPASSVGLFSGEVWRDSSGYLRMI